MLAPQALPWAQASSAGAFGVELTALAAALGLAYMAHAASRRARLGHADSVWSARPQGPGHAAHEASPARGPALTEEARR
jgi:hypothetical protein